MHESLVECAWIMKTCKSLRKDWFKIHDLHVLHIFVFVLKVASECCRVVGRACFTCSRCGMGALGFIYFSTVIHIALTVSVFPLLAFLSLFFLSLVTHKGVIKQELEQNLKIAPEHICTQM